MGSISGSAGSSDQARLLQSGTTYEIWRGPKGGAIRYDWTKGGAIRLTIHGHGHAHYAVSAVKNFETVLRFTGRMSLFFDCWDMTGYDNLFRVETAAWGTKHQAQFDAGYMCTRSKIVAMGVSVANLVTGGKIKAYSSRTEFDIEAKKCGFLLSPMMPGG